MFIPGYAGSGIRLQNAVNDALNIPEPLMKEPKRTGLFGINQRLEGLATNPLFNIGMGMLGSQSPHFSDAMAAGGRGLQNSVMLKEKLKDGATNREYRNKMLELAKQRNAYKNDAHTTAIKNAQFMYPNDPVKQQQAVREMLTKQGGNPPASLQEMQWLLDPARSSQELDMYWQNKRAGTYRTTGRGEEYFPSSTPNVGVVLPGSSTPELISNKEEEAAAARRGAITAENDVQAQIDLPSVEAKASQSIKLLDDILNHKGLPAVVGAPNPFKGGFGGFNIPGTPAADFQSYLDQLGGQVFLEAFQSLKGAGQISEVEGLKAEQAMARIASAQSEDAFKAAIRDYKAVIQAGLQRAQRAAGVDVLVPYDAQSMKSKYGLE